MDLTDEERNFKGNARSMRAGGACRLLGERQQSIKADGNVDGRGWPEVIPQLSSELYRFAILPRSAGAPK
jgi:hypothetical protein